MKWFWADLHFDHNALITKMNRAAPSIEWWNETAIAKINEYIRRNDEFYILGDFAWRNPAEWRRRIECKNLFLIKGNHDRSVNKVFPHMWDLKEVKVHGVPTILCHYPLAFWDKSHYGSYHLYGHIHCSLPREQRLDLLGERRSLDVSPESSRIHFNEYRPFNGDDVHRILKDRIGHDKPVLEPI